MEEHYSRRVSFTVIYIYVFILALHVYLFVCDESNLICSWKIFNETIVLQIKKHDVSF